MAPRRERERDLNAAIDIGAMEQVADPLADDTVAAWMGNWTAGEPAEQAQARDARIQTASRLMAGWTHNGALTNWTPAEADADPMVVSALQAYLQTAAALPDWVDAAQVARAEAIFMEHGPLSCTLLFCASLPECYVLPDLAEVLHIAGQLEAHTEHRIRQTAAMVFPVMMRGGLLSAQGTGVAQVLKVRLIHATIRHLILRGNPAAARGQVPPVPGRAPPTSMNEALSAHGWNVDALGLPCNQNELAYTLLTFSYVFLRGMRQLRQGLSREDEEAYLHLWNVMGHVLGIQRELMAQTMEQAQMLFERMQQHARLAASTSRTPGVPDARAGLGRALMNTMARAIRVPVIRQIPVPLTQWLIGEPTASAIGVDEQVSWLSRAVFRLGLGLTRLVDAVVRLVAPRFSLSRMFTRVIGYHLLTRFLLDQTRPLKLPDRVLHPLQQTVADWSDDPNAHGWVNRLEDRLTTQGRWHTKPDPQRQAG